MMVELCESMCQRRLDRFRSHNAWFERIKTNGNNAVILINQGSNRYPFFYTDYEILSGLAEARFNAVTVCIYFLH